MEQCRTCGKALQYQLGACSNCGRFNYDPDVFPCELERYREIVAALPRPSDEQIEDFVQFVCGAHSWYKHLPLLMPGVRFTFFIDPYAGMELSISIDGSVEFREMSDDDACKFHYTWMTTVDYRSRFSHLSYKTGPSPFRAPSKRELRDHAAGPCFVVNDTIYRVPSTIAKAGEVELTGVIHRATARKPVWTSILRRQGTQDRSWPRETGGDATLQSILALCQLPPDPHEPYSVDKKIGELLLPEKLRLQREMRDAITRMLTLAYE